MEVFLRTITDPGYWIQALFAVFFTCLVLGAENNRLSDEDDKDPAEQEESSFAGKMFWKRIRPGRLVKGMLLMLLFVVGIHFVMCVLTDHIRWLAGIGSWLAYIGGVLLLGRLWSRYEPNARHVCETSCFSTIIIMNELGQIFPSSLVGELTAIDNIYTKLGAGILMLLLSILFTRNQIWKYYIGKPAAALAIACNSLSSAAVIVYDLFRTNVFGGRENWLIMRMMTIILLFFYLINLITYRMIYQLSREQTQVLELQSSAAMDQSAQALMSVTENNLNELHKINHDIKNQYAYMQSLLRTKNYQELESYFKELGGTFARPLISSIDCGNNVLNVILNMELAKAREAGVEMDVQAAPPHTLPFRDLDLCNLYANVIDNAIEACTSEAIENPKIHVIIHVTGGYLFTRVTNPTRKNRSFLQNGPATTKKDARIHGKGREIIRGIVHKYHGTLDTQIENGTYQVEFLLDFGQAG